MTLIVITINQMTHTPQVQETHEGGGQEGGTGRKDRRHIQSKPRFPPSPHPVRIAAAKSLVLLYDSLQLAHKCILNSFYGYVMRKGARWRSMEMAGVVTHLGGTIITGARKLVERVGRPLELDTDGIWCALPSSFPQSFKWQTAKGAYPMAFPCVMLNYQVHKLYTNHQYQMEVDPVKHVFNTRSENSIFFELDGPYRAMVLPASTEEGRLLKKRYAVFNLDGSMAELKGFELKRRGELQIIKIFQAQVFEKFLLGKNLEECYAEVAKVADVWLDVLFSQGENIENEELIELISESKSMSKQLSEYGEQKSTGITTAKRLAEFLGDEMVKSAGTTCTMIISRFPPGQPVTERAIPTPIFNTEPKIRNYFLRKWSKDSSIQDFDIRNFIDWDYYIDRFSTTVRKIITIPAGLQNIDNPVARVKEPDWLRKMMQQKRATSNQRRISDLFRRAAPVVSPLNAGEGDVTNEGGEGDVTNAAGDGDVMIQPNEGGENEEAMEEVLPEWDETTTPATKEPVRAPRASVKRSADFEAWLRQRKQSWAESRRRLAEATGPTPLPASSAPTGYYQVLEIQPSDDSTVVLWVVNPAGQLQRVPVTVLHTLYLNSKKPLEDPSLQSVALTLPLEQEEAGRFLYALTVREGKVKATVEALSRAYDLDTIEGVYNAQMPPVFSMVLATGCVCQLFLPTYESSLGILKHVVALDKKAMDMNNVVLLSSAQHPYLTPKSVRLGRLFVYHVQVDENRGIWAMFRIRETNQELSDEDEAKKTSCSFDLTVVELNAVSNLLDKVPYKRLLAQAFPSRNPADFSVHVTTAPSSSAAHTAVNQYFADFLSSPHATHIAHVKSALSTAQLRACLPALNELPLLAEDLSVSDRRVSELAWRKDLATNAIAGFGASFESFVDRLQSARYAQVPLCNLGTDLGTAMLDVCYGRLLQRNKHVLWCSREAKPDFGGHEVGGAAEEAFVSTSANEAAVARCFCYDMRVYNLCINAIRHCDFLQENQTRDVVSEDDGCGKAFEVLRLLVSNLLQEVTARKDPTANFLLMSVNRWLLNARALLFNPLLLRVVYRLMHLMFAALLQELKRMGLGVVFASYERLVVATHKYTFEDAKQTLSFIVDTVQSKDVFRLVNFVADTVFSSLIWYNPNNFTGYVVWSEDAEDEACGVLSQWSLASLLPARLKEFFLAVAHSYLLRPLQYREALLKELAGGAVKGDEVFGKELEYVRKMIRTELSKDLIMEISRLLSDTTTELHVFPEEVKRYYNVTNPILELVKLICLVMQMEKNVDQEVVVLRRQLLRNMRVKEYSEEAQFVDPFNSFVIPAVFCPFCNSVRNIDLCSDPDLQVSALEQPWKCDQCGSAYDMGAIEMTIIDICNRKMLSFLQQDLKCQKCQQLKKDCLSRYCSCSGKWVYKEIQTKDLRKQFEIVKRKAEFHGMEWLAEVLTNYGV